MRSGSLFSGVGGLDRAVAELTGAEPAWFADNDSAAAKVLAHRFPGVPNLGDITTVDWASVPPVDVLTGGFPCQDLSAAGRQLGLRPGTRSGLWTHMAYAISQLRPRLVVIENVRGILSAPAHSEVEPCSGCVGDGPDVTHLRALGAVLADLADLGYDSVWCGLRASDVGAPHARFRIFVAAAPPRRRGRAVADAQGDGRHEGWSEPAGQFGRPDAALGRGEVAADADGFGLDGWWPGLREGGSPGFIWSRPADGGCAAADTEGERREGSRRESEGRGSERGRRVTADAAGPRRTRCLTGAPVGAHGGPASGAGQAEPGGQHRAAPAGRIDWGIYRAAIERWEAIIGRPAPLPRVTGPRGGLKLNPQLPEWMQGYPAGWFTAVPDISVDEKLRLAGNSVCPRQAVAGLRWILPRLNNRYDTTREAA